MPTNSRAVKYNELVNGKIYWEVIVYINSDGDVQVSPPLRVKIFARPILCQMEYGQEWFVPLSQEEEGKFELIELMPLADIGVDPIFEVQPKIPTHNRLFTTENYAWRHVARMSLHEATAQEKYDALLDETRDSEIQLSDQELYAETMRNPESLEKLAKIVGVDLKIDPSLLQSEEICDVPPPTAEQMFGTNKQLKPGEYVQQYVVFREKRIRSVPK